MYLSPTCPPYALETVKNSLSRKKNTFLQEMLCHLTWFRGKFCKALSFLTWHNFIFSARLKVSPTRFRSTKSATLCPHFYFLGRYFSSRVLLGSRPTILYVASSLYLLRETKLDFGSAWKIVLEPHIFSFSPLSLTSFV